MTEHTPGGLYRRWLHEPWSGERDHGTGACPWTSVGP